MLSAFCVVDRFVADAAKSRIETSGAHSEGQITDEGITNRDLKESLLKSGIHTLLG
jgi:arginine/lysine/ornithine decarboxylase